METSRNYFSLKMYWGQYLVFFIVILVFSCGVFTTDHSDFPNKFLHLFFYFFGSQLAYWAIYVLLSLQLIFATKFKITINGYSGSLFFTLFLAGLTPCAISVYSAINNQLLHPFTGCSIGLAILVAGYHLHNHRKEIQPKKILLTDPQMNSTNFT
jgi:hypothetical protein